MAEHGIEPIDMVVVNLYAFEETARKPGVPFGELVENIDIGGPSMVRSAAKNFEDVAVVTSPADYAVLISEMQANQGALSLETRWRLARQAFTLTAAYDSAIAVTLNKIAIQRQDEPGLTPPDRFPTTLVLAYGKTADLRYGENPHQGAALYADGRGRALPVRSSCRGKSLVTTTWWTWMRRGHWCMSLPSRLWPLSSTAILRGRRPELPWWRRTRKRWRLTRFLRLAA